MLCEFTRGIKFTKKSLSDGNGQLCAKYAHITLQKQLTGSF